MSHCEAGRGLQSARRWPPRYRHRAAAPGPHRPLGRGSRRARRVPADRGNHRPGRLGPGAGPAHPRSDSGCPRVKSDQPRPAAGLRPDGQATGDALAGLAGGHRPGHRPARGFPRWMSEGTARSLHADDPCTPPGSDVWDSLGRPMASTPNSPIWKRWRINYDANLAQFEQRDRLLDELRKQSGGHQERTGHRRSRVARASRYGGTDKSRQAGLEDTAEHPSGLTGRSASPPAASPGRRTSGGGHHNGE